MLSLTLLLVQDPPGPSINIEVSGGFRNIQSTGLPNHRVGTFLEDDGDLIVLSSQNIRVRITTAPKTSRRATPVDRGFFGIALNGVPFDGRPEENWNDSNRSGWAYDTLRNGRALQIDPNNGHARRGGAYHYHGVPIGLVNEIGQVKGMRQVGWAADGFPIYDQFGHKDPNDMESPIVRLQPSYKVRAGNRPTSPYGAYDGTFVQDWEYVAGFGDLDECNGRIGVTPEFPNGTYYYVLTDNFPAVPRYFRGTPDSSFTQRRRELPEW